MSINHVFYKNHLVAEIEKQVTTVRHQLTAELVAAGSDPVVYKRRFRMLQHLNTWHAQILNKLLNFETDDKSDYLEMKYLQFDLYSVVSRNA